MTSIPEMLATLVPAPVIRNAIAAPGAMPPCTRLATSGSDASVLMYTGMPRTAASGTDQAGLPSPRRPVMTPVGMIRISR
jgi:hypothetical protein